MSTSNIAHVIAAVAVLIYAWYEGTTRICVRCRRLYQILCHAPINRKRVVFIVIVIVIVIYTGPMLYYSLHVLDGVSNTAALL